MTEKENRSSNNIPPKTPGWVKVFFIVIILLLVIVVVVHLLGFRFDHGGGATLFENLANYPYLMKHALQQI
jgi:hypothetical protein